MPHRLLSLALAAALAATACSKSPAPGAAPGASAASTSTSTSAPAPVAVGEAAPDVKFTLHDGKQVTLRDHFKGADAAQVLLYFYPKDDTPG